LPSAIEVGESSQDGDDKRGTVCFMSEEIDNYSGDLDSSSDPNFFNYYENQSLAPATVERFTTVRDKAPEAVFW
jgi:hypothetical protein